MFDIGWSELLVIGVVALIAIGPKELPGVLRMVGQWIGKARRMASEFQGQFQEAMREAEMADLKKSFDEVREAASGFTPTGVISSLQRDVDKALDIEGIDKPTEPAPAPDAAAASSEPPLTTPEPPQAETFVEAEAHQPVGEPLAIVREIKPEPQPEMSASAEAERLKDAKAS
ncbi:Sec-independent protein translocase protein TatB [Bradyrhizobium sp. SZCCHNR1015]|uniref:Sec-independent protein translocase protein TatB n=1 Tax=Bradyrhizobium sp. SZCCHNR1015 TaxID=3057338 RepID=UPI0029161C13|nr:Sec-independent protein translocase protein TatB [Bradyrhizobium sp. SZCCHNR1015]